MEINKCKTCIADALESFKYAFKFFILSALIFTPLSFMLGAFLDVVIAAVFIFWVVFVFDFIRNREWL